MNRILVVDDDVQLCESLALTMQSLGNDVCRAYNGKEALDLEENYHPDLIVMDINMPIMNGVEAIKKLRARGSRGEILVLSGHRGGGGTFKELIEQGIKYILTKPVSMDQFPGIIHKIKRESQKWKRMTPLSKKDSRPKWV